MAAIGLVVEDPSVFGEQRPLTQPRQSVKMTDCDPSYPTVCIPPNAPDLDCDQLPYAGFAVTGDDRHGLDADKDGVGCER